MKYWKLWFENLRGRSLSERNPLVFTEPDSQGNHRPVSAVIVGDNGVGKSALLEILTLPSLMSRMEEGKPVGYQDNPSDFTTVTLELQVFKDGEINKLPTNCTPGKVSFYAPMGVASEMTLTLTSGKHLRRKVKGENVWSVSKSEWYYECEEDELKARLIELSEANHPLDLIDDTPEDKSYNQFAQECRRTIRFREIEQESCGDVRSSRRRYLGTTMLINTDLNAYGIGLNICESPKNLRADLGAVLHMRLPATDTQGRLRNMKQLWKDWDYIFEKGKTFTIKSVECSDDGSAEISIEMEESHGECEREPLRPHFLSSGQNEVFTILSAILGSRLEHSVLLLDEPELHLSHGRARRFYRVLSNYASGCGGQLGNGVSGRDLQIIAVTHSPVNPYLALAHWDPETYGRWETAEGENPTNPYLETNRCRLIEVAVEKREVTVIDKPEYILASQYSDAGEHFDLAGKLLQQIMRKKAEQERKESRQEHH